MESRKTVGDIKRRFEVLHEINSNSSTSSVKSNLSQQDTIKVNSNIAKPVDSNAGVNIKRTPAFRCDKGNKKVNQTPKSTNFNNQLNGIIDQTLKQTDHPKNCNNVTAVAGTKVKNDVKETRNWSKPAVITRQNYVSKQVDNKIKPNVNYATPAKKPSRPNYLPVPKSSPRKTAHSNSEASNTTFHSELKQALSSPLPSGPPPKKPPRTFAHNFKYYPDNEFNSRELCSTNEKTYPQAPFSLPSSTMRPIRSKTESQIMLKKLEHVLKQHPNLTNQSTVKETFPGTSKTVPKSGKDPTKRYGLCLAFQESEKFMTASLCKKHDEVEHVYADVKQTINKNKNQRNKSQELHYMCSPIQDIKHFVPKSKMSSTSPLVSPKSLSDGDSKIFESDSVSSSNKKIQSWVNEAYDKVLLKNADTSSDSDSINSAPDDSCPPIKTSSNNQEQLTLERKGYLKRLSSQSQCHSVSSLPLGSPGAHMFECLLLVGIDMDNVTKDKVPYLLKKYPPQAEVPQFIENCVFPDASEWPPPPTDEGRACYTVILTSESGARKYGYCKRVLPEGASVCLPLAYCIISSVKANSFYHKLLEEIERHHGQTEIAQMSLIRELYHQPYPMPGQTVRVCIDNNGHTEHVDLIRRPLNSKKEDTDLINILDAIGRNLFVQVLGSLLLERKVILLSHSITTLSHCIEGLQTALTPFNWQYTLISLVPLSMTELIESPTPYLVGLLKPYENSDRELPSFEGITEMFALDLDDQKVLHRVGDENSIIPSALTKALRVALNVTKNSETAVEKNMAVSEAVLRLYVELTGRYNDFIFFNHKTQCKEFLRESFVKSASSKSTQLFLEWFSETAMFNSYIESKLLRGCDSRGRFEQLCIEFCDETRRAREKKDKGFRTVKNLGEKFKEWI